MKALRIKKNSKAPLVSGAFNGEDENIVRDWIKEGGNWGFLTGSLNGAVVIDIDNHNGVDGAKNLDNFCEAYGIELPDTKTVITPSGGMHLYFKLHESYNDTQLIQNHKELEGVDFQATGRYVLGWGSQIDGVKYQVINDVEMATLPAKWLEMFTDKTIQKKNKKRERKFTANLLGDILAGCDEGSRNNFLTQIIGKLFATGLEHEEVRVWSLYVNQISLNPPLPEEEVLRTYESVRKREIRRMADD